MSRQSNDAIAMRKILQNPRKFAIQIKQAESKHRADKMNMHDMEKRFKIVREKPVRKIQAKTPHDILQTMTEYEYLLKHLNFKK